MKLPNASIFHHKIFIPFLNALLFVTAAIIFTATLVIKYNPARHIAEANNNERRAAVTTIMNAVNQYGLDHSALLPPTIPQGVCATMQAGEICKTTSTCTGLVDLGVLTKDAKYLSMIPVDPTNTSEKGTGYRITKNTNGQVTVCAPYAELDEPIEITR